MGLANYLLIGFLILLVWDVVLTYFYFSSVKHYRMLKDGSSGNSLSEILKSLLEKFSRSEALLSSVDGRVQNLETVNLRNVSKVGLVRFNPFDDAGGDQSFSVSLLDRKYNGVVITSLHGRSGTRIYCKPVISGQKGTYELSKEEKDAIEKAKEVINE